jgi:hypothetical protein
MAVLSLEPEIDSRVDPESGSTLRLLWGFSVKLLGRLANFGSTLWFSPFGLVRVYVFDHSATIHSFSTEHIDTNHDTRCALFTRQPDGLVLGCLPTLTTFQQAALLNYNVSQYTYLLMQ